MDVKEYAVWDSSHGGEEWRDPTDSEKIAKHPYGLDFELLSVSGENDGDKLYFIELPFGSFVPDQHEVSIDFTATIEAANGAIFCTAVPIKTQGGFRYGLDPLDNPTSDPVIHQAIQTNYVEPVIIKITKAHDAPEGETATG